MNEGIPLRVWPGRPFPLGASFDGAGTNFALFSEGAERVELCLFDDEDVESRGVRASGFIIRQESPVASNWPTWHNPASSRTKVSVPTCLAQLNRVPLSRPALLRETPEGRLPEVPAKAGAGKPVATIWKLPADPASNPVLLALVMAGGALTETVKLCVALVPTPLVEMVSSPGLALAPLGL